MCLYKRPRCLTPITNLVLNTWARRILVRIRFGVGLTLLAPLIPIIVCMGITSACNWSHASQIGHISWFVKEGPLTPTGPAASGGRNCQVLFLNRDWIWLTRKRGKYCLPLATQNHAEDFYVGASAVGDLLITWNYLPEAALHCRSLITYSTALLSGKRELSLVVYAFWAAGALIKPLQEREVTVLLPHI